MSDKTWAELPQDVDELLELDRDELQDMLEVALELVDAIRDQLKQERENEE